MQPHSHNGWNEMYRVVAQQLNIAPSGERSIRVRVNEVAWDEFCYCFRQQNEQVSIEAKRWYRALDRDGNFHATATPDVRTIHQPLTGAESAYFPEFFEKLASENEHLLLEEYPGMVLDGAEFTVELFRGNELVRKFEWTSQTKTRGPMAQLEKLVYSSRHYFPDK